MSKSNIDADSGKHGIWFYHALISALGLSQVQAYVYCQLCYLQIKRRKSTFMKSIATHLILDKKTVSRAMRELHSAGLIEYEMCSKTNRHKFNVLANANETTRKYNESLIKRINRESRHENWLYYIDFNFISEELRKQTRSSKRSHNMALVLATVGSLLKRRKLFIKKALKDKDVHIDDPLATLELKISELMKQTGLCANTINHIIRLLIAGGQLELVERCDSLRRRIVKIPAVLKEIVLGQRTLQEANSMKMTTFSNHHGNQTSHISYRGTGRIHFDAKTKAFTEKYKPQKNIRIANS